MSLTKEEKISPPGEYKSPTCRGYLKVTHLWRSPKGHSHKKGKSHSHVKSNSHLPVEGKGHLSVEGKGHLPVEGKGHLPVEGKGLEYIPHMQIFQGAQL